MRAIRIRAQLRQNEQPLLARKTELTKSASARYKNDGKGMATDGTQTGGNVTRSVTAAAVLMPSNNLA